LILWDEGRPLRTEQPASSVDLRHARNGGPFTVTASKSDVILMNHGAASVALDEINA
jgi:hypothetical protein